MKIVLDMMGSDKGSQATKEGARLFHSRHPEIELILVGKKEELADMEGFQIVEANDVLEMDMGALEVLRRKESSMVKAINYCAENGCDAVVSAGSTGAFLSASALRLKKIEGVKRPALVTNFPNLRTGGQVTILDIGASIRNTPEELVQFALMGTLYSQAVNGIKSPKVRLLSNGAEEGKGSEEGKAAYQLLKGRTDINFQGNEEPSKVLTGDSDVIVTSGYDGNVLLKSTEGAAKAMSGLIKKAFKRSFLSKLGYLLSRRGFNEMKSTLDPRSTGGALLCGVRAVAVKGHGNSDALGFSNAIEVAYRLANKGIVESLEKAMNN